MGTSIGANDLFDSGSLGRGRHTTVSGLPTDGEVLFVRLWALMEGTWKFCDFQYTAAPHPEAIVRDAVAWSPLSGQGSAHSDLRGVDATAGRDPLCGEVWRTR